MSNIIEFLKSQEAKEKLMSLYNLHEQAVDTQVKRYQKLADAFAEVILLIMHLSSVLLVVLKSLVTIQPSTWSYRSCKYRHGYNRNCYS